MLIDSEEAEMRSLELAYLVARTILAPHSHKCRGDCPICELVASVKDDLAANTN